jgi:hypothetical protein
MIPRIINAKNYQSAIIGHEDKFIMPIDESIGVWGIWPSAIEYHEWRKNGGVITLDHEHDETKKII